MAIWNMVNLSLWPMVLGLKGYFYISWYTNFKSQYTNFGILRFLEHSFADFVKKKKIISAKFEYGLPSYMEKFPLVFRVDIHFKYFEMQ